MAENTKAPRRAAAKKTPAAKPTATAGEAAAAAGDQAKAQAAGTTANNPASTTKANDPARDTPEAAAAAAAASGTNDAGNPGTGAGEGEVIPPASADNPLEDAAAGNRHSHPAETTAEATVRLAGTQTTTAALNMGGNLPAGEFADPNGPAGRLDGGEAGDEGSETLKGAQNEDGSVQDAVRAAIGAGTGAPDGVGDVGTDPSAAEVVEPAVVNDKLTFVGGKAKLWRALVKGGTHEELAAEAGHRSVLGTIYLMAREAGQEIAVSKDKKTGVKSYTVKAASKKSKG